MNHYVLTTVLFLCLIFTAQADIINGFSQKKQILKKEINKSVELLHNTTTEKSRRQIEKKLKRLRKEYEIVSAQYVQTAQLLAEIEFIDPELFAQVASLTNADATLTHVYVRYVSRSSEEFTYFTNNHFAAKAYTSVRQSPDNPNVCVSLYGTNTITITVIKSLYMYLIDNSIFIPKYFITFF